MVVRWSIAFSESVRNAASPLAIASAWSFTLMVNWRKAIVEHKEYIMGETLSLQLDPAVDAQAVASEVDGQAFSFHD